MSTKHSTTTDLKRTLCSQIDKLAKVRGQDIYYIVNGLV